jgi:hypothetical protein
VKLEILNPLGKVVRTYSSQDPVLSPDPAIDPAAYNKICQETPTAPDCALPLYWPAPRQTLKTSPGMHRFSWDMHYDPLPGAGVGGGRGGGGGNGAVPHRTYPVVNSPWAPPGAYSVRLTANGETRTQPITIKMDPRVKVTPDVQQIFTLTAQMEDKARNAAAAYREARDLAANVKARTQSSANDALLKQIDEIAPAESPGAAAPPNLANLAGQMVAAVMAMQSSEMPPTAAQLQACSRQTTAYTSLMAKWAALKITKQTQSEPRL